METLHDHVWVELVGKVIMARMRGDVTEEMLNERHERVLQLFQDTGCRKVVFDDLEMQAMPYSIIEAQRVLNVELEQHGFQVAIVVPNSRLAYLARMQFGEGNYQVFYNDMTAALLWLAQHQK
jgi:hypothetical protein